MKNILFDGTFVSLLSHYQKNQKTKKLVTAILGATPNKAQLEVILVFGPVVIPLSKKSGSSKYMCV
jgi:hypothetical protein